MVMTTGARPREPHRLPSTACQNPETPIMLRTVLLLLCLLFALPSPAMADRGLERRELATRPRVSVPEQAPDEARVDSARRTWDFNADSASTALYLRDLRTRDMRPPQQITPEGWSVSSPA